ncbi:MAG: 4Fe-4S dicluster domain-containing protein [candidate division KSB1 bacterium]|nr:4Fe-4S dicluster domain-containing protein [candidate division KSB1 bacterium]MDZ7276597.1 4Fe-4S dicluster domain-containing protein [candidate division KSB1 bacterium]MDZ7288230.1 4Fe-4S dicluster domain-containing protein [candidate division KSB1 bacterium]MDZ7300379.1 4Fe-4S dicluster domain-containing protein [candidate division KSB1 bacterium]MDZ7307803.1 4Fe-4S dicluster domain-containing protein [candidate division KSB1 bacterium]
MATHATPLQGPVAPGVLPLSEAELRHAFLAEVDRIPGGGRLNQCIQCGTCSGSCPVSYAMDFSPRQVVALFRAGAIETLLRSRTIWVCASCYHCTVRCPAEIKITDLLYALKRLAIERKIFPRRFPVYMLSESFVDMVKTYGRNYELGLLRKYFLRTRPGVMLRRMGEGLALWRRRRLSFRAERIKGIDGLRRMIKKAETFDRPRELVRKERITDVVGYQTLDGKQ